MLGVQDTYRKYEYASWNCEEEGLDIDERFNNSFFGNYTTTAEIVRKSSSMHAVDIVRY